MFTDENALLDLYSFLKTGFFFGVEIGDNMDIVKKKLGIPQQQQNDKKYSWEDWYYQNNIYAIGFSESKVIDVRVYYQFHSDFSLPIKVKQGEQEKTRYISEKTLIGQIIQVLNLKKIQWDFIEKQQNIVLVIKTEGKVNIILNLEDDKLLQMTRNEPQ